MSKRRLYIVHGMGNDQVGLVGSITTPIAAAGGNIVDLRQDVLHGLFTIYMVVDLTDCELRIDSFQDMIKTIAEDTGLAMSVNIYHPVARNPEKKNMLMILVGRDKPGIIASVSQTLSNYKVNIEIAQNIGREDIFLMELLTDVSHCTLPLGNLKSVVTQKMNKLGITAIFQSEDVFNKKKRVILFDFVHSLIPENTVAEILQQIGLTHDDLASTVPASKTVEALSAAARKLEGLPADVIATIASGIGVEEGTTELLQTLKIMGYKIGIISNGFTPFTDALAQKLDIEHSYGVPLYIDDDSRIVNGEIAVDEVLNRTIETIKENVAHIENVEPEDITIVSDGGQTEPPGIRLTLDLETVLDMYNKHIISKDNMLGLVASLGIQRV